MDADRIARFKRTDDRSGCQQPYGAANGTPWGVLISGGTPAKQPVSQHQVSILVVVRNKGSVRQASNQSPGLPLFDARPCSFQMQEGV
jgi:hypothetical protein